MKIDQRKGVNQTEFVPDLVMKIVFRLGSEGKIMEGWKGHES